MAENTLCEVEIVSSSQVTLKGKAYLVEEGVERAESNAERVVRAEQRASMADCELKMW